MLMFSLVGATVTAATGELPVSPQSPSALVSCRQKALRAISRRAVGTSGSRWEPN